jgi:hypothetical protein
MSCHRRPAEGPYFQRQPWWRRRARTQQTVFFPVLITTDVPQVSTPLSMARRRVDMSRECEMNPRIIFTVSAIIVLGLDLLAPTVVPADSSTQKGAAIPDFSGIWGDPYLFGIEPPLSGPGPVVNKSRRRQLFDADGLPLQATNAPLVSDPFQMVGDYANPVLKPQAAEEVKKHGEISLRGVAYPTPSNQCWPGGVPYVFWNYGMQMLQQPHKITILYEEDHEVRHIRMNQPHPADVTPSWYGDSVGRYEGDTLVIDTVGIKVGPFAMVDMYGTPHTKALHVVERYRLLDYEAAKEAQERGGKKNFRLPPRIEEGWAPDPNYKGKGLQLEFTVEDEGVFTTPWSATKTYRRVLREWPENDCAENTRSSYPGKDTAAPRADKPDF